MTCPHCGTDHQVEAAGWPENWDENRRAWFTKSMTSVGVILEHAPKMANEIEKLSKTSPYMVSEVELFAYLAQSAVIAGKINQINERRAYYLTWSQKITRPLTIKIADNKTSICLKLLILLIIGLPMLILTAPIRLFFAIRKWAINRDFHPYFTGWLKKHGVKK